MSGMGPADTVGGGLWTASCSNTFDFMADASRPNASRFIDKRHASCKLAPKAGTAHHRQLALILPGCNVAVDIYEHQPSACSLEASA